MSTGLVKKWTNDKIKERLQELREQEGKLNKMMSEIDSQISEAVKAKKILSRQVSNNMKYRNRLIDSLNA